MEENNNEEVKTNENIVEGANSTVNTNVQNNTATQSTSNNSAKSTNVCGLVSFIFSMVGIVIFGLPCGIVATILGIIGLATFNPDKHSSRWMAITGLVVGVIEIIIMGLYVAIIS